MDSNWPLAFLEFGVVAMFLLGWLVLEWQCKRLDRKREQERPQADIDTDEQSR